VRQKQLDGLRALAVLGVVAYHHGLLPVGWMGVDLFFVLSGFLITRILTETKRESSYWSQFYVKRAGRILPPLALLLILASVLNRHMTLRAFAGYGLFLGNYVNLTRYLVPMLVVLWSLAIEEHFYIFWPLGIRFL
jgi:peptidoglycan/LPS O-acetylase OafA/YrhL